MFPYIRPSVRVTQTGPKPHCKLYLFSGTQDSWFKEMWQQIEAHCASENVLKHYKELIQVCS